MELHLNRKLQERRTFPAIDIERSSPAVKSCCWDPICLQRVWFDAPYVHPDGGRSAPGAGMDPAVAPKPSCNA